MDRYAVLKLRDMRFLLPLRFFDGMALKIVSVAVGWQIYQLTRDPLALGLIGLFQGLPYMAVALWAGQRVDRGEKSSIMAWAEAGGFASVAGLFYLSWRGEPSVWALYLLLALAGVCRCFQWTSYTTYLQLSVPNELYTRAAAWNTSVWNTATIVGPALGGFVYAAFGARGAYAAAMGCFGAAWALAGRLRPIHARLEHAATATDLFSGVRFVWSEQIVLAAMTLDMLGGLFGGVDGVLPIFAARLGVGPRGLGLLSAAPALGAALSSLYLAHHQPFRRMGAALLGAVAAYGACMVAFPFSGSLGLSLSILAASGVVDAVNMLCRATIYYSKTPDALRGRVSAVNGIFIRASNQISAFESGAAARIMGLVPSVVFGGTVTLLCAATAWLKAPRLMEFETPA